MYREVYTHQGSREAYHQGIPGYIHPMYPLWYTHGIHPMYTLWYTRGIHPEVPWVTVLGIPPGYTPLYVHHPGYTPLYVHHPGYTLRLGCNEAHRALLLA